MRPTGLVKTRRVPRGPRRHQRRANVLLMVVSVLALLFVIVTGYLSLARSDRAQTERAAAGADLTAALTHAETIAEERIIRQLTESLEAPDETVLPIDVPGYGDSAWLAQLEPVVDFGPPRNDLGTDYVYNQLGNILLDNRLLVRVVNDALVLDRLRFGTSVFEPRRNPPVAPTMRRLFVNISDDGSFGRLDEADVRAAAEYPYADADGDGIPDTFLPGVASLTDAANLAAGVGVTFPQVIPTDPPVFFEPSRLALNPNTTGDPLRQLWERRQALARYDAASRIISHGGMVTLYTPTEWNRAHTLAMFNAFRRTGGRGTPRNNALPNGPQFDEFYRELAQAAPLLEPTLRRRGGALATVPVTDDPDDLGLIDALLAALESRLPATFRPDFDGQSNPPYRRPEDRFERYDVGDVTAVGEYDVNAPNGVNDWTAWIESMRLDPARVNATNQGFQNTWQEAAYSRRHALTFTSFSDELAQRRGDPPEIREPGPGVPPWPQQIMADDQTGGLGVFPGELKFYLGEISRAFTPDGRFKDQAGPLDEGPLVVRRLADYYYDMLSWHEFDDPDGADSEFLSRRDQAFMLAVNTVAFAAPRLANGWIDPVTYLDDRIGAAVDTLYVGYQPQPFITQVVAMIEEDDDEDGESGAPQVTIGVELFNPNEPLPAGAGDGHALNLAQFAVTAGPLQPQRVGLGTLAGMPQFLSGREFLGFQIGSGLPDLPTIPSTNQFGRLGNTLEVKLWMRDVDDPNTWHLVDIMPIDISSGGIGLPGGGGGDQDNVDYRTRYRDCSGNYLLGRDPLGRTGAEHDYAARWGTAVALDNDQIIAGGGGPLGRTLAAQLGNPAPIDTPTEAFAPQPPLYLMNAGARVDLDPDGSGTDLRPRSFPTTGFLSFVPRFAHMTRLAETTPASVALRQEYYWLNGDRDTDNLWRDYQLTGNSPYNLPAMPADFGHMPLFFNGQPGELETPFRNLVRDNDGELVEQQDSDDSATGVVIRRVPWGQLVFDYFTTLDPTPDQPLADARDTGLGPRDALKIPGRINVNTAPWTVLSMLPIYGPASSGTTLNAALATNFTGATEVPSPAFWAGAGRTGSGVLVGTAWNGVPRFAGHQLSGSPFRNRTDRPWFSNEAVDVYSSNTAVFHLGDEVAQALVAYRDRVQIVPSPTQLQQGSTLFWNAHMRSGGSPTIPAYRSPSNTNMRLRDWDPTQAGFFAQRLSQPIYGPPRGAVATQDNPVTTVAEDILPPDVRGFTTLGELLNVAGMEATRPDRFGDVNGRIGSTLDTPLPTGDTLGTPVTGHPQRGDFFAAVSLMALMDSQYVTTRSNTFTAYTTVFDRNGPEGSVRSQVTLDRSQMLSRAVYYDLNDDGRTDFYPYRLGVDAGGAVVADPGSRAMIPGTDQPEIIARRRVGYYDLKSDN